MTEVQSLGSETRGFGGYLLVNHELVMVLLTFGGMLFFMMLEQRWPRRPLEQPVVGRWITNWLTGYLNVAISLWLVFLLGKSTLLAGLRPASSAWQQIPGVLQFFLVLLLIEFAAFGLHVAFHRVPLLWRVHAVHHSDTEMDVTTAHRHHFLEPVLTNLVLIVTFTVLGVGPTALLAVILFRTPLILFSHGNIALPEGIDRWLRRTLVTPDFHRLHHSSDQRLTNSNYGAVLPVFDYLFRTASVRAYADHRDLQCGLEYFRAPSDSRFDRLLLMPLRAPRAPIASPRAATETVSTP